MIDVIFDYCVHLLLTWATLLGITYKAINVWIFVILWPIFTLALLGLIVWQQRQIRLLKQQLQTPTAHSKP